MSKSKIFIFLTVSFGFGILTASFGEIPQEWAYIGMALAAAGFALAYIGNNNFGARAALLLFAFTLGVWRLNISMQDNQYADFFGGEKQKMEGYIVDEPDIRSNRQLLKFLPEGAGQRIIITTTLAQEFFYGDRAVVKGKISEPKSYEDFDYKGYLERFNVYGQMSYPKILILKSHGLNWVKENLLHIKAALVKRLNNMFAEPQGGLLLGILIGAKKSLPDNVVENFNLTGTSHIIAVSGFNITILISALAVLARYLGRRFSFWLTLSVIASFVIITGASASVIRAAVMGFLLLLSFSVGRQYAVTPALFFAALVMLLFNPKILFWDAGFQLSFAATLGIVYFVPVLETVFSSWPPLGGIKSGLFTTMAAIISTLPLILYNFGRLSLSAPLVNLLILPAVPWTMLFGFFGLLPLVGPGFALPANWLLIYILKITEYFARLPYGSLEIKISLWTFWLLVASVFVLYFFLQRIAAKKSPAG